jgi:tetratricopeptide (TPR) repeat protein
VTTEEGSRFAEAWSSSSPEPGTTSPTREGRRAVLVLLLAACLLPYANGLTGDFTYDDKAIIRDNPRIRSPAGAGRIFLTQYFGGPRGTGSAYRPVLLLSYAVQWWLGGRKALLFHAVNVALHFLATLLLWRLLVRLRCAPVVSTGAALLFALHPIHVEAVTSLVGRGETLAAVWVLAFLLLALRGGEDRPIPKGSLAGALACYLFGLLTKESAAVAPALALLVFLRLAQGSFSRRLAAAVRRGIFLWAGSALVLIAVLAVRLALLGGLLKSPRIGIFELENPLAPLPALARAGNAVPLLFRALGRSVVPLFLSVDESAWSLPPPQWPSAPALLLTALLAALVGASVARIGRCDSAFGFLFFCLAALPTANLLFPTGTVFAERLAYLPSAGVCLVLAAALLPAASGFEQIARSRLALFAAVVLLFGARTIVRNTVWESDQALFANSVRTSPGSAKAHYNLGWVSGENRDYRTALRHYRRATEIYPKYFDAWAGKGRVERELGMLDEAEASYRAALRVFPAYENGFFGLGLVREARGDDPGAEKIYAEGLAKKPDSIPLAYRRAVVRSRRGLPNAGADWLRALQLAPGSVPARLGYARWLFAAGRSAEGRRQVREALRRHPGLIPGLRLLAEQSAGEGRSLAEGLATERILLRTRAPEDFRRLVQIAEADPVYRGRFVTVRPSLEKLLAGATRPR